MMCRRCGHKIAPPATDPKDGAHREMVCPNPDCQVLLQWDEPIGQVRRGSIQSGPPRLCSHPDRQKIGALVPLER
jgi:hypothetical protein